MPCTGWWTVASSSRSAKKHRTFMRYPWLPMRKSVRRGDGGPPLGERWRLADISTVGGSRPEDLGVASITF